MCLKERSAVGKINSSEIGKHVGMTHLDEIMTRRSMTHIGLEADLLEPLLACYTDGDQ